MNVYGVTVEGRGIRVGIEDQDAVGFFRLVRVVALDVATAKNRATALVQAEWDAGPHRRLNRGNDPQLRVDSVSALPWWHRFLPARRGYIFFPEDSPSNAV